MCIFVVYLGKYFFFYQVCQLESFILFWWQYFLMILYIYIVHNRIFIISIFITDNILLITHQTTAYIHRRFVFVFKLTARDYKKTK